MSFLTELKLRDHLEVEIGPMSSITLLYYKDMTTK